MNNKLAIVVITYNRDESLSRLLQSLSVNNYKDEIPLIISIDKGKNTKVRDVAYAFNWNFGEKRIVEHKENLGLRKHILSCGKYLDEFDAIVVLEDDLIVSSCFLQFADQAVSFYKNDNRIAGISLFSFPINYQTLYPFQPQKSQYDIFFMKCAQSWGQIWLKNQWTEFEEWYKINKDTQFDTQTLPSSICKWNNKSWLKYHTRYCIEKNKYFVYPYTALSSNCGECGEHLKFATPVFQTALGEYPNNKIWNFDILNESSVRYDGYLENENIYKTLNLSKENLCIDLTMSKNAKSDCRYLLTVKPLNYKVVKSFGLTYWPIELNILNSSKGSLIFLYDTSVKETKPLSNGRQIYAYYNRVDIFASVRRLLEFGLVNFIKTLFGVL